MGKCPRCGILSETLCEDCEREQRGENAPWAGVETLQSNFALTAGGITRSGKQRRSIRRWVTRGSGVHPTSNDTNTRKLKRSQNDWLKQKKRKVRKS